ncbi:10946_t:CDS:2, partial [Gigaspora rosea]
MQSEIDPLRRVSELEAKKTELEAKNTELLKHVMEENAKREAENKQTQAITNEQEPSPTKDISPLIESRSDEEKDIIPNPLPDINN